MRSETTIQVCLKPKEISGRDIYTGESPQGGEAVPHGVTSSVLHRHFDGFLPEHA